MLDLFSNRASFCEWCLWLDKELFPAGFLPESLNFPCGKFFVQVLNVLQAIAH